MSQINILVLFARINSGREISNICIYMYPSTAKMQKGWELKIQYKVYKKRACTCTVSSYIIGIMSHALSFPPTKTHTDPVQATIIDDVIVEVSSIPTELIKIP